jgi:hypothetical protein
MNGGLVAEKQVCIEWHNAEKQKIKDSVNGLSFLKIYIYRKNLFHLIGFCSFLIYSFNRETKQS